ncbi:hypothetical protein N7457_006343 [Penicillium paradoxum]|uniref:uncharacterized protein n=1 Tax=Penicillium paradoxum TaxID=176176 RepID=UPI002547AC3F|nr:uncharacterized protein N7457_006343 [Penicillium paradoxum]KAJ5781183.1 hypothetical protein N7457_006343 [Penicillium paradoxum]
MGATPMVDAVRGITLCVAILCTTLYIRRFVVKSFGLDDYLVILSLILVNGFSALAYTITYYGLGDHQRNVIARGDLVVWLKIYYAALCSYLVVAAAVKLSLIAFIMRVFPQRYVQRIGYGIIAFIVAFTLSGELLLAFQCKPVHAFWDKTILTAECFTNDTLFAITMYQGVLMFICDVVIIVLPMPAIWRLHMALKKRLLIFFLFSFGFIACAAALVRFTTLVYTKDATDMTSMSLIWMEIEFNFGLLAGSLGSIRQLFKIKSIFSSQEQYGSSRRYELQDIGASGGSASANYPSKNNRHTWRKGEGILKSLEVTTTVDEYRPDDGSEGRIVGSSDSQEHIVPVNGGSGNGMIYGQGDSIRVDVRSGGMIRL